MQHRYSSNQFKYKPHIWVILQLFCLLHKAMCVHACYWYLEWETAVPLVMRMKETFDSQAASELLSIEMEAQNVAAVVVQWFCAQHHLHPPASSHINTLTTDATTWTHWLRCPQALSGPGSEKSDKSNPEIMTLTWIQCVSHDSPITQHPPPRRAPCQQRTFAACSLPCDSPCPVLWSPIWRLQQPSLLGHRGHQSLSPWQVAGVADRLIHPTWKLIV